VNNNQISFSAVALSEAGFSTFINNLKTSSMLTEINIAGVSLGTQKDQTGIKFSAKMAIKEAI
jgi:hypothetical protein